MSGSLYRSEGALDTSLRLSIRGHPAPTHPSPTLNLVNINKLATANRANRMWGWIGEARDDGGAYSLEEETGAMQGVGMGC